MEPGIDVDDLASDERGHGVHQEPDHVSDFVRLAETVRGNHLQQLSALASGGGTMMARISGGGRAYCTSNWYEGRTCSAVNCSLTMGDMT